MKHKDLFRRLLLLVALAAVFVVSSGGGTNCMDPNFHAVYLHNLGRDPIHVGNTHCDLMEKTLIAKFERFKGGTKELSLSRMDINLGVLKLVSYAKEDGEQVTITMREPTYFDFRFESDMTDVVEVTHIKP